MRFASLKERGEIADVLDDSFHPYSVAAAGWKPGVSSVPGEQFNGDALPLGAVAGRFDHGGARVDADRVALRADDASNAEQLRARAAPDVANHVAGKRREFGEHPRLHLLQRGETLPVVQEADELFTEPLVALDLGEHRSARPVGGFDVEDLDGLIEALQRLRFDADKSGVGLRSGEHPHESGCPRLVRPRQRAQTRGFHHRGSEPVALVVRRLAGSDPDPKADRRAANDDLQCLLLHRERAVDRVDRTSEHGHEAVAGVLDLGPGMLGQRLAKH